MPFNQVPDVLSKIKYDNTTNYTTLLDPGELGFNYFDNTLYIGDMNPNIHKVIPLVSGNLTTIVEQYFTTVLDPSLIKKIPTSSTVYNALLDKVDLHHSNTFTGMNQFPYLRIATAAPSQKDIVVTIRMLTDYLLGDGNLSSSYRYGILNDPNGEVAKSIAEVVTPLVAKTKTLVYDFVNQLEITINHNMNTTNFSTVIRDSNGDINVAPIQIIDVNNFKITFSYPMTGNVEVTFYYG